MFLQIDFNNFEINRFSTNILNLVTNFGLKILGAILVLLVGRWIIRRIVKLLGKAMEYQLVEPTLIRYLGSALSVLLNIALFVAIFGSFGFETTTFAALLAGVGVAIGAAWSGLLANFAAGVFLLMLRPFKVGDYIQAGGVTGTVKEIGMFITMIETADCIVTYAGNNKIFSENIQNFSASKYRRVDLKVPVDNQNPLELREKLLATLQQIPNVEPQPAIQVELLELTPTGAILTARLYCDNKDYWQVYFDSNRTIAETLQDALTAKDV